MRLADFAFRFDAPILIVYEYDFGDSCTHAVSLTVVRRNAGVKYPRCIQGNRSSPPEDVGGPIRSASISTPRTRTSPALYVAHAGATDSVTA